MKEKLTVTNVKNFHPKAERYDVFDTDISGFGLRVNTSGTKKFFLMYRNSEGKKIRYTIGRYGSISFSQAKGIAQQMMAKVVQGFDIQADKLQPRIEARARADMLTLRQFIDLHYEAWCKQHRKNPLKALRNIKSAFLPRFGDTVLEEISILEVEKWSTVRLAGGIKPSTVNRYINDLKGILGKAIEWKIISLNPLKGLAALKIDQSPNVRYLNIDEEKRLRNAMLERDNEIKAARARTIKHRLVRAKSLLPDLSKFKYPDYLSPMILTSINTGLRRGELFGLKVFQINFEDKLLTVIGDNSKNGQTRYIPLNEECFDVLRSWIKDTKNINNKQAYVFSSEDGKPFDNVDKAWRTLVKGKAKIADFRWHDMRHHFASKLVLAGVDLYTISSLLGHSDVETTKRYAHIAPEHKARAVNLLKWKG
ncbi:MAG: site-specific integrase [Gammaproteobacteria bacterium]|nr:site-specific integrase [Gammaproteobacteria bacterium]